MNSWIMSRWLEAHNKEEHPDLSITQEDDALHVLPESRHPSEESIKRMCSPVVCSHYKNRFIEGPMDFRPKESFEKFGYPPPYEEPVLTPSRDCAAYVVNSTEDLISGYALPVISAILENTSGKCLVDLPFQ